MNEKIRRKQNKRGRMNDRVKDGVGEERDKKRFQGEKKPKTH